MVAAGEVFDEVGYEAATISEILKRSGVTKGALYFHFSSKEELAQNVLGEQVSSFPEVPERDLVLQKSLDEALLMAHLLQREGGDAIVRGGVRLTVDQGAPADSLDRLSPMRGWVERNVQMLEKAKAAGELLAHVDLQAAARLLVGAFTGVQVMSNIMTGRVDMPERVVDLYRHLLPSIAVPGVLVQLDFRAERGAQVHAAAMELRRRGELAAAD
ncbi:putative A-factor receptor protein [Streptomyces aurantiacus JA 4570]|uniref:Putative A-factor receptor protein n=1 Tax=Streptomyces aurantiacus JA 4570 TaxID=1286094 RepID=S3ZT84_9ACTN|nr:putative A-factor receptor protein [Streptomyces aurantiacus JA 4570]